MIALPRIALLLCLTNPWAANCIGDQRSYFHEQVEKVLRTRCFECHSHATGNIEGNLALDWRSGWELGGDRGPALVPGKPEQSLLVRAIRHQDNKLRMPEEKLPEQEIAILTRWIEQGAFDDRVVRPNAAVADANWWSLQPLRHPTIPGEDHANPIDAFVTQRLTSVGLTPSNQADRRTLIRRLSYDLTGLPPTYEESEAFAADPNPSAYDLLVDRLLDSPHYGERWARHWFDTIHFADSHGYEHDIGRDHAWRYRDYAIAALNQDTLWPRFIREQLAADYFYRDEPHLIPALGFLGAGTFDLSTFSTAPVTFDYLDRDDLVTQTMAAFASTTANCARCHAHKFDPITQEDYYALQAVFAGILKGDVAFDVDVEVSRQRSRWQSLLAACEQQNASELLSESWAPTVASWIDQQANVASWRPLALETFVSTGGATLSRNAAGIIIASGVSPDQDTYVVSAQPHETTITAMRLDVHADESLPMRGPGRCQNGNLHLTEIELQIFEPGASAARIVKFASATADFNQTGWGIERAIDGDPKTAWGIHPAVGQSHHAVFLLAEPLALKPESRLTVTLRQLHGGSHLIGAFTMSVTPDDATQAIAVPHHVEQALSTPNALRTAEQRLVLATQALRSRANEALKALPPQVFVYAAATSVNVPAGEGQVQAKSLVAPKPVHLLQRGDFDKPRDLVQPGALSALLHLPARFALQDPNNEAERRAALADWLAHPQNPLTWRSIVNRVWLHHFGKGICDTPNDFGRMGGAPTHLELLDWLAVWFRDDAHGSLKQLHRLIVTSQTYQQDSLDQSHAAVVDADNRLLWRQTRQRLDADAVRDFTLAISGAIDLTMGGPAIQHFRQSKGPQSTPALDYTGYDWAQPGAARRSIYRYVWRGIADPFMEAMDFPDLGLLSPTRGFSASSLQSLTLYNNDFVLHFSQVMAQRVEQETTSEGGNLAMQINRCTQLAWLRNPTDAELKDFTHFVDKHGLATFCRLLLNSNEFLFVN